MPDLDAWWLAQADDIALDRALMDMHWHRVNAPAHVCDASTGQFIARPERVV